MTSQYEPTASQAPRFRPAVLDILLLSIAAYVWAKLGFVPFAMFVMVTFSIRYRRMCELCTAVYQRRRKVCFVLLVVLVGFLVWYLSPPSSQKRAVLQLQAVGAEVIFGKPYAPEWARRLLEKNYFAHVETLSLRDLNVYDADLKPLRSLRTLHALDMSNTHITDDGLELVGELSKLYSLDLCRTRVSDSGIPYLTKLKSLTALDLRNTRISSEGVREIGKTLPFSRLLVYTDAGLKYLPGLPHIPENVDRAVLEPFCRLPSLGAALIVNANQFKPQYIENWRSLTELDLPAIGLTDTALTHFEAVPNLRYLNLGGNPIEGNGLVSLKGLTGLQLLMLDGTHVDDHAIADLAAMTSLTFLDIQRTSISELGLRKLQESLPKCTIVHQFVAKPTVSEVLKDEPELLGNSQ